MRASWWPQNWFFPYGKISITWTGRRHNFGIKNTAKEPLTDFWCANHVGCKMFYLLSNPGFPQGLGTFLWSYFMHFMPDLMFANKILPSSHSSVQFSPLSFTNWSCLYTSSFLVSSCNQSISPSSPLKFFSSFPLGFWHLLYVSYQLYWNPSLSSTPHFGFEPLSKLFVTSEMFYDFVRI